MLSPQPPPSPGAAAPSSIKRGVLSPPPPDLARERTLLAYGWEWGCGRICCEMCTGGILTPARVGQVSP